MAGDKIALFLGELPILDKRLLPQGTAQIAINTKLTSGALEPWKNPSLVTTPTKGGRKRTIYRFGEHTNNDTQFWFTWTTDVDCIRVPLDGDTSERTYFTGDSYPKKTDNALATAGSTNYPANAYKMGVPAPVLPGTTASVSGTPTNANSDPSVVAAYVFTYVTGWGEEGAPSLPIGPYSFQPGQQVNISSLPSAPSGNYNVVGLRLYRSNTGSAGTNYQFVADIPLGQSSYVDSKASTELGEVISTFGWLEPPDDGFGLVLGANGNAIMFSGKTIHPCVPSIFYAYPSEYELSCASEIVGGGAFGQSFAVLTKSNPYIVTGIDPRSYTQTKIDQDKACVSKKSIVQMLGGVVYAAKDGLWIVNDSGLRPLTEKMFSEDQFKAFKPESIVGCTLEGRYYMFYDNGTKQGLVIFDFLRETFVVESDQYADAAYYDPLQGCLYLSQGTAINKWDGGAPMQMFWKSREYRYPRAINPGYARVEADAYPVSFIYYVDGTNVFTKTVNDKKPFRLPSLAVTSMAVAVITSNRVTQVSFAETGEEIALL